ncbi:hypothetical protein AAG565_11820 [Fontimonas sp. SYSU GA230001]
MNAFSTVMPAQAGIQNPDEREWIPAFARMTNIRKLIVTKP